MFNSLATQSADWQRGAVVKARAVHGAVKIVVFWTAFSIYNTQLHNKTSSVCERLKAEGGRFKHALRETE